MQNRRNFLMAGAAALAASRASAQEPRFRLSLAEWSINRAIRAGKFTNLDFPRVAREHGCDGVEFVNTLFASPTAGYLNRLKGQMKQHNITPVLIMVDDEGMMGHSAAAQRIKAADNHRKWVDIAAELGCHSIRTNMYPEKQPQTPAEIDTFLGYCAESFNKLTDYAGPAKINVIIENHGGVSSKPEVVVALMKKVNKPNFGTLPDFGNFPEGTDKVAAVKMLMPYAKGVSYKCHFDGPDKTEVSYDLVKMLQMVEATSYRGFVGIEFEGRKLDELEGIKTARAALAKLAGEGLIKGWKLD
jgi:sugar phosphate isomerase/epimerase